MLYFYSVVFSILFGASFDLYSVVISTAKENRAQERTYDSIYPYYLKYCSMSRIHPKVGHGRVGGSPGHAVLYIKGACVAPELGPSGLKVCSKGQDYSDPDLGVGISTNRSLRNVNFVSIPGQSLFFGRDLLEGRRFTQEERNRLKRKLIQKKVLLNVEFHPHKKKTDDVSVGEFYSGRMFGTDYGIALARNIYCINI